VLTAWAEKLPQHDMCVEPFPPCCVSSQQTFLGSPPAACRALADEERRQAQSSTGGQRLGQPVPGCIQAALQAHAAHPALEEERPQPFPGAAPGEQEDRWDVGLCTVEDFCGQIATICHRIIKVGKDHRGHLVNPSPPCPLNHVPQCHIYTFVLCLQPASGC